MPVWEPHKVARLRELWQTGLSSELIGKELGDVTPKALKHKVKAEAKKALARGDMEEAALWAPRAHSTRREARKAAQQLGIHVPQRTIVKTPHVWTDTKLEAFRALCKMGKSDTEMAEELGILTGNAISAKRGKLRRAALARGDMAEAEVWSQRCELWSAQEIEVAREIRTRGGLIAEITEAINKLPCRVGREASHGSVKNKIYLLYRAARERGDMEEARVWSPERKTPELRVKIARPPKIAIKKETRKKKWRVPRVVIVGPRLIKPTTPTAKRMVPTSHASGWDQWLAHWKSQPPDHAASCFECGKTPTVKRKVYCADCCAKVYRPSTVAA